MIAHAAHGAGLSQVQGLVFLDRSHNGQRESGESGIADIKVQLLAAEDEVVAESISGADGSYSFAVAGDGSYQVRFSKPSGFSFSPKDNYMDEATDSDVNPYTGETDVIALTQGEVVTDLDAGLFEEPTIAWITDFRVERKNGGPVWLLWETGTGVDIVGFNIYRSTALDGGQEMINAEPIFSTGPGNIAGAVYGYEDSTALKDASYYYWLELLRVYGPLKHGPVSTIQPPKVLYLPILSKSQE